jgi:beta-N-acetylglucosaminidase
MRNKLKLQWITYLLGVTFFLAVGSCSESKNYEYSNAPAKPSVNYNLNLRVADFNMLLLLQPSIKNSSIKTSKRVAGDSQFIVQAIQKEQIIELANIELISDAKYEVTASAQVQTLSLTPATVKVVAKPTSNVKSDSGLMEANIEEIFKGTSLAGFGLEKAILEIEEEYGINAYFTIAVMKLESGNGKSKIAKDKNNLFGLNAIDGDQYNKAFSFKTKGDSVQKFGQLISENYIDKGFTTIEKVSAKYCQANPEWSDVVMSIMKSDYSKL